MDFLEDNSMSEFHCQICVSSFNQTENLPKILPCGHTVCRTCLANIRMVSNSLCPVCKREIGEAEPATNFSLLKLCDAFTDTPTSLRNDVARVYVNRITKNLLDAQLHFNNALKEATSLRAFGYENEFFSQELEDARISFNEIEKNMTHLKEKVFQSREAPEVNLNIKTLKLQELAERICKGEKIFTLAFINEKKKFGKIFKRGNFLFINALTETEIPKGSSLFWLCDLLRYHLKTILPYVAVNNESNQQITTYVFSNSLGEWDHGTLEIFTGESDQLLKGCVCVWKEKFSALVIKIEKNKCININIQERKDRVSFKECVQKNLSIPAEISVTNHQRNPVLDSVTVGKFFKENNLGFLFPKDNGVRRVQEHGIVLMTNWNKIKGK
ncbi:UNVERIFIED_CONTAM: hypothetical protein RMT77_010551 [Armadillidium vulgare]